MPYVCSFTYTLRQAKNLPHKGLSGLGRRSIIHADDPATLRQIETLRALQAAELRLAELRCAHVPPATTA